MAVICLGLIGLSPLAHAETFADRAVVEANTDLTGEHTFGEHMKFKAGIDFRDGQTFPAGTFFSGAHTYPGDKVYTFTGNGIIFGDGSAIAFSGANTFGPNADFSASPVKDGEVAGKFSVTNTFKTGTMFAPEQVFGAVQNFEKYTHFNDNTDFTAAVQTFREGMTFAEGSVFNDEQVFPVNTVLSHGIVINEVECSDSACVPDPADVVAPGEKYGAGTDPAAILHPIRSDSKTFGIDGLGLTMTFDTVSTDGNIKADLVDPATVAGATLSGTTLTMEGLGASVGNVIDLSADTASITGDIVVTLPYQDSETDDEENLTLYHYVNNIWIEEQNCTTNTTANTVTCTVDSLSPFSVGSKSGSAGASSTGSSGGSGSGCSLDALNGKSLRMYEIKYNLCALSKIEILGYSTCGALNLTVKDENGLNHGKVNPVQNYLNQTMLSMVVDVSSNSNSYNIQVQNIRDDVRHLLIPEKLHGELLSCTGNVIIEQFEGGHTGYTSNQENSQSRKISDDESSYIPRTENVSNKIFNDEPTIVKISENLLTEPEPPMYEPEPPMYEPEPPMYEPEPPMYEPEPPMYEPEPPMYEPEPPMYEPEPPENFFLLKWLDEIFSWMILDSK